MGVEGSFELKEGGQGCSMLRQISACMDWQPEGKWSELSSQETDEVLDQR